MNEKTLYTNYLRAPVTLVGAGGIGSNVAPLLAKLGVERLTVYDDDVVEPVNLAMQNFGPEDLGKSKAAVVGRSVTRLNPQVELDLRLRRFAQGDLLDGFIIAAVDSMQSREVVFDEVMRQRERIPLFIDGRFDRRFNEFVDLYAVDPKNEDDVKRYRGCLFSDSAAFSAPRPEKISAHTPYVLAGLIGCIIARFVHEGRHPWKVTFDGTVLEATTYGMVNPST